MIKMKKLSRILCFILAFALCFSIVACGRGGGSKLEKDDRLIDLAKKGSSDGEKTRGFIIYNKTDGEVFTQNP